MKINSNTLKKLEELNPNHPKDKSAHNLVSLFNQLGYDEIYRPSFYDKWYKWSYVDCKLRELNNQGKISLVLYEIFHPINFIDNYIVLDELILDFNILLRYDDYTIVRKGDNVRVVNLYQALKQLNSFAEQPRIVIGMLAKIKNIQLLPDYRIHIYLEDGFDFVFDFTDYLDYQCNKELKNFNLFKQAKFKLRMIYWDDNHDIHLDQMIPDVYRQHIN